LTTACEFSVGVTGARKRTGAILGSALRSGFESLRPLVKTTVREIALTLDRPTIVGRHGWIRG
jgi:hypothetical protein